MKHFLRWTAKAAALGLAALALEGAWYAHTLNRPLPPLHADMLAVFDGMTERYVAGMRYEHAGRFRYLVFSDATADCVQTVTRLWGKPLHAEILMEPRARTTAQNARYVAALAESHGCRSVLVETSWYHVPRALFLMRLALLGSGIRSEAVAADAPTAHPWDDPELTLEMVKFWGSLATYTSDTRHHGMGPFGCP